MIQDLWSTGLNEIIIKIPWSLKSLISWSWDWLPGMIGMIMLSLIGFQQISGCETFRFFFKIFSIFPEKDHLKNIFSNSLLSFIRSISQISREGFLLVERICWVFSLRLNTEVNLVLLIDIEETGAGGACKPLIGQSASNLALIGCWLDDITRGSFLILPSPSPVSAT